MVLLFLLPFLHDFILYMTSYLLNIRRRKLQLFYHFISYSMRSISISIKFKSNILLSSILGFDFEFHWNFTKVYFKSTITFAISYWTRLSITSILLLFNILFMRLLLTLKLILLLLLSNVLFFILSELLLLLFLLLIRI